MLLSKSQIRYLRGLANTTEAKYQLGKNELNDNNLEMLSKALDKYELIKVSVNRNVIEEKNLLAVACAEALHAELVQEIGGVFVLYRKNLKEPKIKLPR